MGDPNVFIIESLTQEDEKNKFKEGGIITKVLNYYEKITINRYIHSRLELINAIEEFKNSKCKYLHFSSHADNEYFCLTNEDLQYIDFANIIGNNVKGKRIFFSSCFIGNDNFANIMFSNTNCLSITGFEESVYFQHSAVIWASFYTLIFNLNENRMPRKGIFHYLDKLSKLFLININHYQRENSSNISDIPKKIYWKKDFVPSQKLYKEELAIYEDEPDVNEEYIVKLRNKIRK